MSRSDTTLQVLAVIPARGGSRGIPRKNLQSIGGKSLVQLAIECCKQSRLISRILLSTDSQEIARESERHGVSVPVLRPSHLATDSATDGDLFSHILVELEQNESYKPDILVNVRPTAPLRVANDIDSAIAMLIENPQLRSIKSVCLCDAHPRKMWSIQAGELNALDPHLEKLFPDPDTPRQLLPEYYQSNGAVDACWTKYLRIFGRMHTTNMGALIMPRERSLDIDNSSDLEYARHVFKG